MSFYDIIAKRTAEDRSLAVELRDSVHELPLREAALGNKESMRQTCIQQINQALRSAHLRDLDVAEVARVADAGCRPTVGLIEDGSDQRTQIRKIYGGTS
jgi:hypothetical protein